MDEIWEMVILVGQSNFSTQLLINQQVFFFPDTESRLQLITEKGN